MSSLPILVVLPVAMALVVAAVFGVRRYPRAGLVGWLAVVAFVPVWFGLTVSYYFQPASIAGICVAVGFALRPPRRLCVGDLIFVFLIAACLLPILTGGATTTSVFVVLTQWLVGFLVGRLATGSVPFEWICSAIAVVFTVVAIAAVVEYAADWHPYVNLGPSNDLHSTWGGIQVRGGQARSEGAFGHAIALGASLAMALPFVLGSRFRSVIRIAMCAVMLAAVVVTFSRAALGCAVAALLLTALFVRDERVVRIRRAVLGLLAAGAVIAVPLLLTVFAEAGSEAERSGAFRGRLMDLIPGIEPLGSSSLVSHSPSGALHVDGYRSVDNAVLLTGLMYGAMAVVFGLALLAVGAWVLASGRGSVAVAAITAQIPALFSVSFITQYGMFLWFVAGLAVATSVRPAPGPAPPVVGRASAVHPPPERSLRAVQ